MPRPLAATAFAALALCAAPPARPLAAQAPAAPPAPFTVDDALDLATWTVADLSDDGRWLAATAGTRRDGLGVDHRREGDPTYVRPQRVRLWAVETATGARRAVLPDARVVRSPAWSPDGGRLAFLLHERDAFVPAVWERASGRLTRLRTADGREPAENGALAWTRDGRALVLAVRPRDWRERTRARFRAMTEGPVFVQDGSEPFLAWDDLRREGSRRAVVALDVATRRVTELVPEGLVVQWRLAEDGASVSWTTDVTPRTDYAEIFGVEQRLEARPLDPRTLAAAGPARTLAASLKGQSLVWARDGRRFAVGRDGRVYVGSVADTARRLVAGPPPGARADSADTSAAARARRAAERFAAVRFSPAGDALVLSNPDGLWLAPLGADGAPGARVRVAATDTLSTSPRVAVVDFAPGGDALYLSWSSRARWQRGLLRWDRATRRLDTLALDARLWGGVRVARDGDALALTLAEGNRPADVWVAGGARAGALRDLRRVAESNPWLAGRALGSTELVTYLDADGARRAGVVYYPPGGRPARPAPTVFEVYEDFFDDAFSPTIAVLNAAGYVVVRPSVGFETGYPGEAWLKGVTAAANALVERGVADSARLGVQGTSYGGYATNLLVTQTHRFKAAVNVSGKVDLVSFYTDSPRLGTRNVHAAERSQDRIGATLWQAPMKYVAHSAIFAADRIRTPMLLVTGNLDPNVPADNTREMYYALRRLGKEVTWVNYMNGGHGTPQTTAEDFADYHRRLLAFYDRKLRTPPAPGAAAAAVQQQAP
jgi:dipeptidyl aminopeptidase/acylaminoacyl peptidase